MLGGLLKRNEHASNMGMRLAGARFSRRASTVVLATCTPAGGTRAVDEILRPSVHQASPPRRTSTSPEVSGGRRESPTLFAAHPGGW